MLIFLVVVLTIMKVALQVSIVGLELSYQVGKRVDTIRKVGETIAVGTTKVATSPLKLNKTGKKVNSVINKTVGRARRGVDIAFMVAKPVVKVGVRVTISSAKILLRVLKLVVSILRDALVALTGLVLVLDIFVFIVLSAIASYYILFM